MPIKRDAAVLSGPCGGRGPPFIGGGGPGVCPRKY